MWLVAGVEPLKVRVRVYKQEQFPKPGNLRLVVNNEFNQLLVTSKGGLSLLYVVLSFSRKFKGEQTSLLTGVQNSLCLAKFLPVHWCLGRDCIVASKH